MRNVKGFIKCQLSNTQYPLLPMVLTHFGSHAIINKVRIEPDVNHMIWVTKALFYLTYG